VAEAIVGREAELGAIERFLRRVPEAAAALLIEGEAGIGKTTVWLEAVRGGHARGFQVLELRPSESEAQLSYVGLADLLDGVFDATRAALPNVQERALAAALLREEADRAADPRTTATALVAVLAQLAASGPVLLAIDDVQWLDSASERALSFAARRLPPRVGLLLTRRVEVPSDVPLGLERAGPDGWVERLVPAPLSLAALHHVIKGRLGWSLPRPLLERLLEASGGNPFFALEIARALGRDAAEHRPGDPLPVPHNVEELVAARLRRLSDTARQASLAAAALSRPTPAAIVDAVALGGDGRGALVEAEEAGVLVSDGGRVRFSHPLLASVVYASASAERRRALHERLAAIVEDPEERARHLALCTTEPDAAIAAQLEDAAQGAATRGAQQAAAELFAASRRLTPPQRVDEAARRALGEASALLAAGDVVGARALAEPVAATACGSLRGQALYLLGEIGWISGSKTATESLEAALTAAADDADLAARAYHKLVNYTVAHDPARAIGYADAAMQSLDPNCHAGALASVVFDRFWATLLLGRGPQRPLFEQWRELEDRAGPEAPKSPIPLIYFVCTDEFEAARAGHAVEDAWYRDRGEEGWRAERLAHLAFAELRAGNLQLAESYIEESCSVIAQLEKPGPWAMPFRLRSFVDACAGRTERARETIVPLLEEAERIGRATWAALLLSALGFVEFVAGDHRAADRAFTRMRELADATGTKDLVPDRSEPMHVESLLALDDRARARLALERLEERGRTFPRLWITATLPRARALVLAADGDFKAAFAALDVLDVETASKLPFDLAWTLLVRGRLHRRVKQKRAAADVLGQALELFERLGMPAGIERARAELGRVGLRRAPDELTASERRVAELVASGLTNREVASAAFMSPKTVQANLTRVYRKLGIRSRAELGARMAEARAVGPQT
jgi:DNA-binding CsgD family transcriptional regulator